MGTISKSIAIAMLLSAMILAGCETESQSEDDSRASSGTVDATVIPIRRAPAAVTRANAKINDSLKRTLSDVGRDQSTSCTLQGQILHFADNRPVANAHIKIRPHGTNTTSPLALESLTDSNGQFYFSGLPAGRKIIATADTEGQQYWLAPGASAASLSPTLRDGEFTTTTIVVFSGHTIQGTVFDHETSETLAGATLTALVDNSIVSSATSGLNGAYKLERIPHRSTAELDVQLKGYTVAPADRYARVNGAKVKLKPGNSVTIDKDIAMLRNVVLSGRVQDIRGIGIPGATLEWMNAEDLSRARVQSDSDGKFELPVTPFQTGCLTAKANGYGFHNSLPFMQISNKPIKDLVLTMEPGSAINGLVEDINGSPISGASVYAAQALRPSADTLFFMPYKLATTDHTGSFKGEDFSSGPLQLTIEAADFITTKTLVQLATGETKSLLFQLNSGMSVAGRVMSHDGKPMQAYVDLANGQVSSVKTDSDGNFRLTGLQPGRVELTARNVNCYGTTSVITVAGTTNLVIKIDDCKWVTRACRVIDHLTRKPVKSFQVSNFGTVTTEGKAAGEFDARISTDYVYFPVIAADGYLTREFQSINWDDKRGTTLEFEMGIGAAIRGRLLDESSRQPVTNFTVSAKEVSPYGRMPVQSSVTDAQGYFTISNLPYGEIEVTANSVNPSRTAVKKIEIPDGEVTDIGELLLPPANAARGL